MQKSSSESIGRQSLLSESFDPYLSLNYMLNDIRVEHKLRSVRRLGVLISLTAFCAVMSIAACAWLYLPMAIITRAQLFVTPSPITLSAPDDVIVTRINVDAKAPVQRGEPILMATSAAAYGLSALPATGLAQPQTDRVSDRTNSSDDAEVDISTIRISGVATEKDEGRSDRESWVLNAPLDGTLQMVASKNQTVRTGEVLAFLIEADATPVVTTTLTRLQIERLSDAKTGSIAVTLNGRVTVLPTHIIGTDPQPGTSWYNVRLAVPAEIAAAFSSGALNLNDTMQARLLLRGGIRNWFRF